MPGSFNFSVIYKRYIFYETKNYPAILSRRIIVTIGDAYTYLISATKSRH
jgi:hypothetical protein